MGVGRELAGSPIEMAQRAGAADPDIAGSIDRHCSQIGAPRSSPTSRGLPEDAELLARSVEAVERVIAICHRPEIMLAILGHRPNHEPGAFLLGRPVRLEGLSLHIKAID